MRDQIRELKQQILAIVTQARAIIDGAEKGKRNLTTEETTNYDKAMSDVVEMKQRADRMETQLRLEESLAQSASEPNRPDPAAGAGDNRRVAPTDTPEYRAEFNRFLMSGELGKEMRALQADSPAAGGYLLAPQEFITQLIQGVDDLVFIRRLATVMKLTRSDNMGAPELTADPADADWTSELGTGSEDSTMAVGKRDLKPNPLAKRIKVGNKLLRISAIPAEQLVRERLAYKFGITEEKAFMSGSGHNQPLGIFVASASGINTGRDVRTSAATSWTFDDLKDMKYNIKSQYHAKAQWVIHRAGVKLTSKLKDGEGRYIWVDSDKIGEPDKLLGFPVNMSEYAPSTYTANLYAAVLGDFSFYWIADLMNFEIQRLSELYAATNQTGFIGRTELDGAPVLQEAFTRLQMKAS